MIIGIIAQQATIGSAPTGPVVLTIPASNVGANLSGFPVRLDLSDMPERFWDGVENSGGNIRVYQGGVALPIDLVRIDEGDKTGELFFRANLSSTVDNVFSVTTLPGGEAPAVSDPIGRHAVWAGYWAVVIYPSLVDRTSNGRSVVETGTVSYDAQGWLQLSGAGNSRIDIITRTTTWTMGASVKLGGSGLTDMAILSYGYNVTGNSNRATVTWRAESSQLGLWNSSNTWLMSGQPAPAFNTRFRVAATHQGSIQRQLFVNGALAANSSTAERPPTGGSTCMFVGAEDTSFAERMTGQINYVYHRAQELTPSWLAAEYLSWETNTFYTVS